MIKRTFIILLICSLLPCQVLAQVSSDQEYVNKLKYQREKLELVTKVRQVDVSRSYTYTDIDTYTYSFEAYTQSHTDVDTQTMARREKMEISEWHIYRGGLRELSDAEFLALVGDQARLEYVMDQEEGKGRMRLIGNVLIGTGILVMIGGAAASVGEATVTAGAIGMTLGFFIDAFNLSPQHYIEPDYAMEKIDEYNINLKRQLDLPLDYN